MLQSKDLLVAFAKMYKTTVGVSYSVQRFVLLCQTVNKKKMFVELGVRGCLGMSRS